MCTNYMKKVGVYFWKEHGFILMEVLTSLSVTLHTTHPRYIPCLKSIHFYFLLTVLFYTPAELQCHLESVLKLINGDYVVEVLIDGIHNMVCKPCCQMTGCHRNPPSAANTL